RGMESVRRRMAGLRPHLVVAVERGRAVPGVVEDRNERARGRRRDDEEGESRGRRKSPEAPRHAEKIEDWPVDGLTLPGFVNAHSHAFQRAMRGRAEGADFWAWREAMLDLARAQGAGRVRKEYVDVYREMLAAGYTAVGEFHYIGLQEALAAGEAAAEAGIELVLLYVAYARGGIEKFRQGS